MVVIVVVVLAARRLVQADGRLRMLRHLCAGAPIGRFVGTKIGIVECAMLELVMQNFRLATRICTQFPASGHLLAAAAESQSKIVSMLGRRRRRHPVVVEPRMRGVFRGPGAEHEKRLLVRLMMISAGPVLESIRAQAKAALMFRIKLFGALD